MFSKLWLYALLGLFISAPISLAQEAPFWLPADAEVQLIPQAATKSIQHGLPGTPPVDEFADYANANPPLIPPRTEELTFYPCSQCHDHLKTNETPRQLAPVHEVALKHGEGRLWCLTCHNPDNRDKLRTVRDSEVDFNDSWKVCGQCHANRQKDWFYGAHGKRIYSWEGEPVRYNCTHCHNPHQPPFMHRKPQPKPPVRAGLEPMKHAEKHHRPTIWERHASNTAEEEKHD